MSQEDEIRKIGLWVKMGMIVQAATLLLIAYFVYDEVSRKNKSDAEYQTEITKYHQLIDDWKQSSSTGTATAPEAPAAGTSKE